MSIEDRQWYKEDSVRRAALPDPLGPKRYVRSVTTPEPVTQSAPKLPSGLIALTLLFLLAVGSVASCFF
jgi:hypothetical protein